MTDRPLRILVIEDDPAIAGLVRVVLTNDGHTTDVVGSATEGLARLRRDDPDVVVLDLGLPDRDGLSVLREIRAGDGHRTGVVCLTARADEIDRVVGFELGADDYVVKPFSPRELAGRIRALGRRVRRPDGPGHAAAAPVGAEAVEVGDVTIDLARREVRRANEVVALTPLERDLAEYLVRQRGLAVSRLQILEAVWGHDWLGESRTVDMHIAQLRKKLGPSFTITTIRGVGYRLE